MRAESEPPARPPLPPAEVLAEVSDALAWPLLLVRADTTLLHANLAARELLRHGQPLALSVQRELRAADPRHRVAFERARHAALNGEPAPLMRWPAGRDSPAFCAAWRLLPKADGGQAALLLAACPDSGRDADLLALLALRPPLVPPKGSPAEGE